MISEITAEGWATIVTAIFLGIGQIITIWVSRDTHKAVNGTVAKFLSRLEENAKVLQNQRDGDAAKLLVSERGAAYAEGGRDARETAQSVASQVRHAGDLERATLVAAMHEQLASAEPIEVEVVNPTPLPVDVVAKPKPKPK